jgi:short-subunit dehydrogenase
MQNSKKAIVVGATSGIGRELAILLAADGYKVGITGRRLQMLEELHARQPDSYIISAFDVTATAKIPQLLDDLVTKLGGLDLLILSAGTGKVNPSLDPGIERHTNEVNVAGFTAVINWAMAYFEKQGSGHFASISSIAGIRGSRHAPAYGASKAYQISYLEGMRQRMFHLKKRVTITDVQPGFVDTAMASSDAFWMAPVNKAAKQILKAIYAKRNVVYITKRWRLIAYALKLLPGFLYKRM